MTDLRDVHLCASCGQYRPHPVGLCPDCKDDAEIHTRR